MAEKFRIRIIEMIVFFIFIALKLPRAGRYFPANAYVDDKGRNDDYFIGCRRKLFFGLENGGWAEINISLSLVVIG